MSLSGEELEVFLLETDEGLAALERCFLVLERDPTDQESLARSFRVMHTIKGTSGFFELKNVEGLAHAGENLLARLREGDLVLNGHTAALLLSLVDGLKTMVAAVKRGEGDLASLPRELIDALNTAAEGAGDAPAPAPALVPASPSSPAPAAASLAAAETSIRVDVQRLDGFMSIVGELVLIRNQIAQQASEGRVPSPEVLQDLNGVTAQLQEGVLKVRMQPLRSLWSSLPRVVRDLAASLGKQVDLVMDGADTELDRAVIDSVRDPLVHSVRNAIDHGLERPEVRLRAGKSPRGRLHLRAWHEAGVVHIAISDDGAGINLDRVRAKAVERGLLDGPTAALASEQELVNLLFVAGFSTADAVTSISGRGVGMDVVRQAIEGAGGRVQLATRAGAGTTLTMTIPLTLAIISGLIVRSGAARYAISRANVDEVVHVERSESFHGVPVLRLRGALVPLVDLRAFLSGRSEPVDPLIGTAVIVRGDGRCFGLVVDEVLDMHEIVVKPLPKWFREPRLYSGLTILGDGLVTVILDIAGLGRRARVTPEEVGVVQQPEGRVAAAAPVDQVVVVSDGRGGRCALRLSEVVRIEEIERQTVEWLDGRATVQYRGFALPLVDRRTAAPPGAREPDRLKVVVMAVQGDRQGLVVDDILDIADATPLPGPEGGGGPLVLVNGRMAVVQNLRTLSDGGSFGGAAFAGARLAATP